MSVVGIDFGNVNTVIAVARNRGIDVICNEVSNRATPSLVSFGSRNRYIGESAKTQEISNFKNTISSLKRLVGRSLNDAEIGIEKKYINCDLVEVDGQVAAKVTYQEQEKVFTGIQLCGMFLGKLKELAQDELKCPVSDVVISVPSFFNDHQRRAMLDAAEVAGLNCLRLLNDTTAVALAYGITKLDLPEEKPRHVCFIDIGHSCYSVTIVAYVKGKLQVLASTQDTQFGGRDFDELLVEHFHQEFLQKNKIDIKGNAKALFRLRAGIERSKKILSANLSCNLSVESIMDDKDVSASLMRSQFEEMIAPLLEKLENPIVRALEMAKLTVDQIDFVETVGGSTRVPSIKERLVKFFGKELSVTLNQDEAVARGCALQCAMLSPTLKVREFQIVDLNQQPIKLVYEANAEEPMDTTALVFETGNSIPSTKIVNFERSEPFDVEAFYANETAQWIGKFGIKDITPAKNGGHSTVKVKVRLSPSGLFGLENVQVVENVEEKGEDGKMKKVQRKRDVQFSVSTTALPKTVVTELREQEISMASTDKLVFDTSIKKNQLEEYIYDMRSKLENSYSDFIDPSQKSTFSQLLTKSEDWLYAEGEDSTKSAYQSKLEELQKFGQPMVEKYRQHEELPKAEAAFRATIKQILGDATSEDEKFAHIPKSELETVAEKCTSALDSVDSRIAKQKAQPKFANAVVTPADLLKEQNALMVYALPILARPKPVVEQPKEETKEAPKPEAKTE